MPRVAFLGVATSGEDDAQLARVRAASSRYPDQVLRVIRYFVAFTAANPDLQGPGKRRPALLRFVGQALAAKRAESTVSNWWRALEKFRVDPNDPAAAIERVEHYRVQNGLTRLAAARTSASTRVAYDLSTLAQFCEARPVDGAGQEHRHLEFRTIWFVLLCSGNRPDNVVRAAIEIEDDGLVIRWRNRKERAGGHAGIVYPFEWAIMPPADIRARLGRLNDEPWLFPQPRNVAGAINRWLEMECFARDLRLKITTGATRCRLSTFLRRKVEVTKEMTSGHFEEVMDHKIQTSRKHYATENLR